VVGCEDGTIGRKLPHPANRRSSSQSVRNPTTWFQLGVIRDAGPEIRNGLGAFPLEARSLTRGPLVSVAHTNSVCDDLTFCAIWIVWY
jgi:hypothetical protein